VLTAAIAPMRNALESGALRSSRNRGQRGIAGSDSRCLHTDGDGRTAAILMGENDGGLDHARSEMYNGIYVEAARRPRFRDVSHAETRRSPCGEHSIYAATLLALWAGGDARYNS